MFYFQDITDFLQYKKLLDFRKKEVLHKQWNKSVYQPIQKEIEKEINGPTYSELSKRKRELHKEYLEHTNKKVSINRCRYCFPLNIWSS